MEKQNRTKHTSREKGKLGEEKTQPVWCLRNWPCNFQMNRIRNKKKAAAPESFTTSGDRRRRRRKIPGVTFLLLFLPPTFISFHKGENEKMIIIIIKTAPAKYRAERYLHLRHTHTQGPRLYQHYTCVIFFRQREKKGRTAQWFTTLRFSIDAHHSLSAALRPFSYQFFSGDINQEIYKKKKKKKK